MQIPSSKSELFKALWTNPVATQAMLWAKLPLAAFAGLRVIELGESGAKVLLPAGWKTQNPFRSTYFAAQAMAAEMSAGAPALFYIQESGADVSSLVTGISAKFTKKATQDAVFTFAGGAGMKAAIDEAVRNGTPTTYTAQSRGEQEDGTGIAEFEIHWSFKRR